MYRARARALRAAGQVRRGPSDAARRDPAKALTMPYFVKNGLDPLDRILTSSWFLVCTAACSAAAVALASWLEGGVRVSAFLIGIAFALAVMLVVAWAFGAGDAPSTAPAAAEVEPAPAATAAPVTSDELVRRLEEGRALRDELEAGASDPRVDEWIDRARDTVERDSPRVAGYFNALAAHSYDDDVARLDAHLRRLATIVRDLL
jgi:hypothetical protein